MKLEVPFQEDIQKNFNKAHAEYLHSETCRRNRAIRKKIVARKRKDAIRNQMYFGLLSVCLFFASLIVVGWTI
nr:MAG TPA: hypothetical protein [Caudoviricetes sp.]